MESKRKKIKKVILLKKLDLQKKKKRIIERSDSGSEYFEGDSLEEEDLEDVPMQANSENEHVQGGSVPANQQSHKNSIGSSKELEAISENVGCEREVGILAQRGVSFSQPIMENENAHNITIMEKRMHKR